MTSPSGGGRPMTVKGSETIRERGLAPSRSKSDSQTTDNREATVFGQAPSQPSVERGREAHHCRAAAEPIQR